MARRKTRTTAEMLAWLKERAERPGQWYGVNTPFGHLEFVNAQDAEVTRLEYPELNPRPEPKPPPTKKRRKK